MQPHSLREDTAATCNIEEALSLIGTGRFQRRLLALCGFAICADAMEKSAMMYIYPSAAKEWQLDGRALGYLGSSSGVGQALGAYTLGRFSDVWGRRQAMLVGLMVTFVPGLLCVAASRYWIFVLLRFITNIGLGGMMPVGFTLLSEFLPARDRSRWLPYLYASYGVGRLLTGLVAWCLVHSSWRQYMLAIAMPSGFLLLLYRVIPDTAQFLLARGRDSEACAVIDTMAAVNGVKSPLGPGATLREGDHNAKDTKVTSCVAIGSTSASLLCICWLLVALGSEWGNWALRSFLASGTPEHVAYAAMALFNGQEFIMPLMMSLLPTTVISQHTCTSIIIFSVLTFAGLVVFAAEVFLEGPPLIMLGSCILGAYSNIGIWVILYAVTSDYFPAEARGTGFGTCMMFNRLGYIIGPLLAAGTVDSNYVAVILACSGCYVAIAVTAMFLGRPAAAEASKVEMEVLTEAT